MRTTVDHDRVIKVHKDNPHLTFSQLAERFNTSKGTISGIVYRDRTQQTMTGSRS